MISSFRIVMLVMIMPLWLILILELEELRLVLKQNFFVSPSILPHLAGVSLSSSKQWENMDYCEKDIFIGIFGFPSPGIFYQKIDYRFIGGRYYDLFTFTIFDDYPTIDHYWKVVLNPYYWWLTHGI